MCVYIYFLDEEKGFNIVHRKTSNVRPTYIHTVSLAPFPGVLTQER